MLKIQAPEKYGTPTTAVMVPLYPYKQVHVVGLEPLLPAGQPSGAQVEVTNGAAVVAVTRPL